MELTSPAFEQDGPIPTRHTCGGEDLSPPLEWRDVPEGTGELALSVEDPDAPGGTFVHWILANVDPHLARLQEAWTPPGSVEGVNGFGRSGWAGPCPPHGHGRHRYVFTLYALSSPSGLAAGASMGEFRAVVESHELERAVLVGTYER